MLMLAVGAVAAGRIVDNVFNTLNDGGCITNAETLVVQLKDFDTVDVDRLGYTIRRAANNTRHVSSMATVITILASERGDILGTTLEVLETSLVKLYPFVLFFCQRENIPAHTPEPADSS